MKKILNNISKILKVVFGYSIMITLLLGGLTFVGYLIALVLGGEVAVAICEFIYKGVVPSSRTPAAIRSNSALSILPMRIL